MSSASVIRNAFQRQMREGGKATFRKELLPDLRLLHMIEKQAGEEKSIRYRDRKDEARPDLRFPPTMKEAVGQNIGMITKYALHVAKSDGRVAAAHLTVEDIVHFGKIGVLDAYVRFDPEREILFPTYANYWIRAIISTNLVKESKSMLSDMAISRYQMAKKAFDAYKSGRCAALTAKESRLIYSELKSGKRKAAKLEKWLEKRNDSIQNAIHPISLETPINGDGAECLKDTIRSPYDNISEELFPSVLIRKRVIFHLESVLKAREALSETEKRNHERNKTIFMERCMPRDETSTLNDLGKRFGVSRERIRQIEQRLLRKVIARMRSDPLVSEIAEAYFEKTN